MLHSSDQGMTDEAKIAKELRLKRMDALPTWPIFEPLEKFMSPAQLRQVAELEDQYDKSKKDMYNYLRSLATLT